MQELSEVSEAARDLEMAGFRLIQPYLEERRSLKLVAAEANLSFRIAQRWVSQYKQLGLAAFVRKVRDDPGGRRVVSKKIREAIEGLALERPPLPIRSVSRKVRAFAQSTGESMPSYGTVYDLVREVPNGLLTFAHHGSKAYSEAMTSCIGEKRHDQTPSGRRTMHNWASSWLEKTVRLRGPWLTIVIDDYSRAIAGYYLGFDPPSSMRTWWI